MAPPLALTWIRATVAKAGQLPEENEDASAGDAERMRFAVADGATEGWQSGPWAAHLAAAYLDRTPTPADFTDWLSAVRSGWVPPVATRPATWYSEAKQEQGSFATFLGLEFRESKVRGGLAWKAVAVGDSCLFLLRGDRFEATFPISAMEEFGNRPALVPSSRHRLCPPPAWLAGWVQPGDLFLLATDAASRVLLGESGTGRDASLLPAIRRALVAGSTDLLTTAITDFRETLNDDATIVAIQAQAS